ncbi:MULTISPECIES: hypothetical protein [unclassified Streptomyces]|uniref:hypothetical protein n=1 Tax=unclassified Streptomyces TaxID=2593676 RepID=UPI00093FA306|nr:hypothetical protein [Streptomyces sp. TSRI0281]OKI38461.1 hypothetical protein A6A29_10950 [Streptomyces sp. TSRI0281]
MADSGRVGGQVTGDGDATVALRITVSGTHRRKEDLAALCAWLKSAPALNEARGRDELRVERGVSLTQSESMGGAPVHDILLVVAAEAARPLADIAWNSVRTWHRNRRRLANPEEEPRVRLDAEGFEGDPALHRDTDTPPASGGGPAPGGRQPGHGDDRPEGV